ncbi:MAG: hypothetical protein ACKOZY_08595, partial [Flavobacteriales bacterium]
CVLALFISFSSFANSVELIQQNLIWSDLQPSQNPDSSLSLFHESSYDFAYGNVPCVVKKIPLNQFGKVAGIHWLASETATLSSSLLSDFDQSKIQENWRVSAKISDGRGKPYLIVTILPIRQTAASEFERLLSFTLEVEWTAAAFPTQDRDLNFASQSVLNSGTWFKIAIGKDGVYKIDKNLFNQLGVSISTLSPSQINIYGNGGELLPEENDLPRKDDLEKCAIYVQGEDDGVFNDNDFILFYGKGPDSWKTAENAVLNRQVWEHEKHYYSDSAYYFIRIDDTDPLRLDVASTTSASADYESTQFQDYVFQENDTYNIGQSGREFFGDLFEVNTTATYSFNFPNIVTSLPASVETSIAVRSIGGPSNFTIQCA